MMVLYTFFSIFRSRGEGHLGLYGLSKFHNVLFFIAASWSKNGL